MVCAHTQLLADCIVFVHKLAINVRDYIENAQAL